ADEGRAIEAPDFAHFRRTAQDPMLRERDVLRGADAAAHIFTRAAETGEIAVQMSEEALGRGQLAVARIVIEFLTDGGRRAGALLFQDEQGCVARNVADLVVVERIVELLAYFFRQRIADAEIEAGAGLAIGAEILVVGLNAEEVDARRK